MIDVPEYDPKYLAGILWFNRRDYFAAHEVWEDLWRDCDGADRRFYQGLIQAAVAIHHALNGNWRGARRLFHSGRKYMFPYPPVHLGLAIASFWDGVEHCLKPYLGNESPIDGSSIDSELAPTIALSPAPGNWPDPESFRDQQEPGRDST